MFSRRSVLISTLLVGPTISVESFAMVYISESQVAAMIFPGQTFKKLNLHLSPQEQTRIKEASGEPVRAADAILFKATSGETVFIDRVIGKHEFISYAVGIGRDGKVKGVEILEYRESYGHEVRGDRWRAQFIGKDKTTPLRIDQDIKNISGATLSSTHITNGVRRILQTYDVIKPRI